MHEIKHIPDSIYHQRNEFPCTHHFQHVSGNTFCPSLSERHQNLFDLLCLYAVHNQQMFLSKWPQTYLELCEPVGNNRRLRSQARTNRGLSLEHQWA